MAGRGVRRTTCEGVAERFVFTSGSDTMCFGEGVRSFGMRYVISDVHRRESIDEIVEARWQIQGRLILR